MRTKPNSKAGPPAAAVHPAASAPSRAPNPLRTQDSRWQRMARFNWDKGGSKGGRR